MLNDKIEILIDKININGEGIGFYNGKKVCVKNVLPNEKVLVDIQMEKPNFIFATLNKVIEPNPKRIVPKCKYFDNCGGCDLQFLNDCDAIELKKKIVSEYFELFYPNQIEFYSCNHSFGYRNKISFVVKDNKIGLLESNSNKIVEIDKCLIANENINKILKICKDWLNEVRCPNVRHIVVRYLQGEFLLSIVLSQKVDVDFGVLIEKFENCFNKASFGIYLNINSSKNEILGNEWHCVYGLKKQNFEILGIKTSVHPYSFLQVNNEMMKILYKKICEKIKDEDVLEGYSGVGLLSALVSKNVKKITSVEINKKACLDAKELKEKNSINNWEIINGSCVDLLPELATKNPNATFLIDPPQSGCDLKTLQSIIDNKIKKIVYVSCNPYTLRQNIGYLKDFYNIKSLEVFDMFPNTFHFETLCVLERKMIN